MHRCYIEDEHGELVDVVELCSDSCHRTWCRENGERYGGWNGALECDSEEPVYCASCGVLLNLLPCGCETIVVNRIPREEGERCPHGGYLQLPALHIDTLPAAELRRRADNLESEDVA